MCWKGMFSAIQIVEDVPIAEEMLYLAAESKQVSIDSTQTQYPQPFEVKRLTSTFNPEIVFLELTAWERVVPLVEAIRAYSPDTAIVGIGEQSFPIRWKHR